MTEICKNVVFPKENVREKKPMGNTVHYVYVLLKIRNKAFLFLFTLIPLLFTSSLSSFGIIITVLVQLLTLSSVLIPALLSRYFMRWSFDGRFFCLSSGYIAKKELSISAEKITSVSVVKTPFLSFFHAVRLDMRCSDGAKNPEITLWLSHNQATELSNKIMHKQKPARTIIPRTVPFLLMTASRANFAAGLSAAAVFLFSLNRISKNTLPEMVYDKLSETSSFILPYLPPFFAAAAALFLSGWLINFIKLCFSDARLVTTVSDKGIITVQGLVSTHLTFIKRGSISSCFIKRTLLSSFFGQGSIGISHCGKAKRGKIYSLSAWHIKDFHNTCFDLAGFDKKADTTVYPSSGGHFILWLPFASLAAFIALLWLRVFILSPSDSELFSCFATAAILILLWKCCVGISAAGKISLGFSGQHIAITAVRLFSVYSQKIYLGKIAEFSIRRTLLQKMRGLCTVYIKAAGSASGLKCPNLPFDTVNSLSERIL